MFNSKIFFNKYYYTIKLKKPCNGQYGNLSWRYQVNFYKKRDYWFPAYLKAICYPIIDNKGNKQDISKILEEIHITCIKYVEDRYNSEGFTIRAAEALNAKEHGPVVAQIKNV
jgi:hypothetical protein